MKYPREWLGFEVNDDGAWCRQGTIVELVEADVGAGGRCALWPVEQMLGVRVLDESRVQLQDRHARHPVDGWLRLSIHFSNLTPLTRAARAVLAGMDGR